MRTPDEIKWALGEWSRCTTLDPFERTLIQELRNAIEKGIEPFRKVAEVYCDMFHGQMMVAMQKAQAQGLCLKWDEGK